MMADCEAHELIRRWIEVGWNQRDSSLISKTFHESYRGVGGVATIIGEIRGHDGIRSYVEKMHASIDDLRFEILDLFVGGELAMLKYRITGKHVGSLYGEEPTQEAVDVIGVDLYKFHEDGRILHRSVGHDEATDKDRAGQR